MQKPDFSKKPGFWDSETHAMPADPKLVRDLFLAAVELPAAERAAYLTAHCGGDAELRAAVERLLAAHDQPAGVLDRLNLFMQVCQAVQHAHQKGIIHRDLKPSNILVAPYDDKPVPKVIDFGLAKAMHQSLTERTLHTAHETVLGTPLYMSPEQT